MKATIIAGRIGTNIGEETKPKLNQSWKSVKDYPKRIYKLRSAKVFIRLEVYKIPSIVFQGSRFGSSKYISIKSLNINPRLRNKKNLTLA